MRRAISMIELIFSIVILGIVFLSIPLIIQNANTSLESTHDSKGYYHALALMQIIIAKPWDHNNIDDLSTSEVYYILGADCVGRTGLTPGESRRMCDPALTPTTNPMIANANYAAIDHFQDYTQEVEGFTLSTSIAYADPNLKLISIPLSKNGALLSTYYYYAANIGTDVPSIKEQ